MAVFLFIFFYCLQLVYYLLFPRLWSPVFIKCPTSLAVYSSPLFFSYYFLLFLFIIIVAHSLWLIFYKDCAHSSILRFIYLIYLKCLFLLLHTLCFYFSPSDRLSPFPPNFCLFFFSLGSYCCCNLLFIISTSDGCSCFTSALSWAVFPHPLNTATAIKNIP